MGLCFRTERESKIKYKWYYFCCRYLCEKVVPGNRVTVMGVYAIKKTQKPSKVRDFICDEYAYRTPNPKHTPKYTKATVTQ